MDANMCPKVTVTDSKPEPVMCELKTQADSQCNIFMFAEVQKGKDVNPTLQRHFSRVPSQACAYPTESGAGLQGLQAAEVHALR